MLMDPEEKFLDWVKIISEISISGLKARKHGEEKYFSNFLKIYFYMAH